MWSDVAPRPQSYYQGIVDWYAKGGHELIAGWLLSRDITAHLTRKTAPATEAKEMMQLNTLGPMEAWVHEGIRDGAEEFTADLVELGVLLRVAKARFNWQQGTPERMASTIRKLGARSLGRVRFAAPLASGGDNRGRLYSVRRHEMYANVEMRTLAELYLKQQSAADRDFAATG
jgi:hypothetical protein